jgi:hypothetical protein
VVHSTQAYARLAADSDTLALRNPADWEANRAELMAVWQGLADVFPDALPWLWGTVHLD